MNRAAAESKRVCEPSAEKCCSDRQGCGWLKLHFACWEGLVLHGHRAVAAEDGDGEIFLPLVGLLVPVVHRQRIECGDQSHLHIGPGRFALQQGVQNRPHDGLLVWLVSTNYIAG